MSSADLPTLCTMGIVGAFVGWMATTCARPKPDVPHPPAPVRVLAKHEERLNGFRALRVTFGTGGYIGTVPVDVLQYDHAAHWSCIEVRCNETTSTWSYVGASTRCAP